MTRWKAWERKMMRMVSGGAWEEEDVRKTRFAIEIPKENGEKELEIKRRKGKKKGEKRNGEEWRERRGKPRRR